MGKLLE